MSIRRDFLKVVLTWARDHENHRATLLHVRCLKIQPLEDDIRVGSQYLEVEEVHLRVRRMCNQNVHIVLDGTGVCVDVCLVLVIDVSVMIIC